MYVSKLSCKCRKKEKEKKKKKRKKQRLEKQIKVKRKGNQRKYIIYTITYSPATAAKTWHNQKIDVFSQVQECRSNK